ncbi:hypothetical protein BVAVS116_H0137 (plasmid) [Borreliella valaisiana VS116]|uniref:Uncharacterized protein n=1 Tax=Borreliella valaisiana VS116 TaxID=445987 RepID=C0R952_BORVA|nr:hypothetical protein BVAVS116_H0137 [Borreliella valaisiana VS116]
MQNITTTASVHLVLLNFRVVFLIPKLLHSLLNEKHLSNFMQRGSMPF